MHYLHIKNALLPEGWAEDVRVDFDERGNIAGVTEGIAGAESGCLLPGIANLHSHAHQRAMAGLAERAGKSNDSFWTWRATMYRFLEAIEPHHLHAIAAQLYLEMLKAGYTRVAEFQYLHHQADGRQYDSIAEMSLQTLEAARGVGIGISNLPVLYQFGGFGGQPAADQQCRFANNPDDLLTIIADLQKASGDDQNIITGVAAHSLRAVTRESFSEVLDALSESDSSGFPVHINTAEQKREVEDCIAWSGARPIEHLYTHFNVNHHWCLVHATHMTEQEMLSVANSGAVAGLCPTTEANLGDGFFKAKLYINEGGSLGIGSDSHISVSPTEELRWLEYGQRLAHGSRNELSGGVDRSTGRNLFDLAVTGGAIACGHNSGAIEVGKRADFVLLDTDNALLCERQGDELIDSWIFSGNEQSVRDVYVGGRCVIRNGRHADEEKITRDYQSTIRELRAR